MRRCPLIIKVLLLTSLSLIVLVMLTGTCMAVSTCSFTQASATLSFGNLDETLTYDATATVIINVHCTGNLNWYLTGNNGLHFNGSTKRMKHQSQGEYIPYTLTFSPTTGNKFVTTVTGSGIILNSNYISAIVGTYYDTVTLTIMP